MVHAKCILNKQTNKKKTLLELMCDKILINVTDTHPNNSYTSKLMNNIIFNCFLSYFPCFVLFFCHLSFAWMIVAELLHIWVYHSSIRVKLPICFECIGFHLRTFFKIFLFLSLSVCCFSFIALQSLLYKKCKNVPLIFNILIYSLHSSRLPQGLFG